MIGNSLILAGVLYLSQSNPALIPNRYSSIWISDPKVVQGQVLDQKINLSTPLESGSAIFVGSGNTEEKLKIHVLSDKNYSALKKCPQWAQHITASYPLLPSNMLQEAPKLKELSSCGFETAGLQDTTTMEKESSAIFQAKELLLKSRGILVRKASWESQQRHIWIDQSPQSLASVDNLLDTLRPFYKVHFRKSPQPGQTLIVELTLFEFLRQSAESLGLDWPQHLKIFSVSNAFDFRSLNPKSMLGFDLGQTQGLSKVLSRPRLRLQAGEKASFQSGGEIPISLMSENRMKTEWKSYGLILDFKLDERAKAGDAEVSLDLSVEFSQPIAPTSAEGGTPSFQVRKLSSRFDLRINESTLLSSMTQNLAGSGSSGLAGLMNIPVAGSLFSKSNENEQSSELWFALRPTWEELPYTAEMRSRENAPL